MKRNFKGFILGIVFTLVATSVIPVAAASVQKQIPVFYNDIKLVVNGNPVALKDGNGKEIQPFLYEGTTYLPIRAVADALGQNVSWDGNTNTVYIGQNAQTAQPSIWLGDMKTFAGNGFSNKNTIDPLKSIIDNTGSAYQVYAYNLSGGDVKYLLNQQYRTFTGRFTLRENAKSTSLEYRFKVYADDTLVYTSPSIYAGALPIDFSVNVSNAVVMRIVCEWKYYNSTSDYQVGSGNNEFAFVNAGFWQ